MVALHGPIAMPAATNVPCARSHGQQMPSKHSVVTCAMAAVQRQQSSEQKCKKEKRKQNEVKQHSRAMSLMNLTSRLRAAISRSSPGVIASDESNRMVRFHASYQKCAPMFLTSR